jgi:hypothetical protein
MKNKYVVRSIQVKMFMINERILVDKLEFKLL